MGFLDDFKKKGENDVREAVLKLQGDFLRLLDVIDGAASMDDLRALKEQLSEYQRQTDLKIAELSGSISGKVVVNANTNVKDVSGDANISQEVKK